MGNDYVPIKVILPVTSIGVFMSALDGSIVNIALPSIADAFATSIAGVSWIVIIYLLTISALIGLAGTLGDTFGRKKIFQLGMLLFVVGSILCSMAPTLEFLIGFRAIQAMGAAGLQANGLALVVTYIDPDKRGRAIGINSLVVASALTIGPALGGILTDIFGWESIFLINIPIGIIGIIVVELVIRETEKRTENTLDYVGVALFILTSFGFIAGIQFYSEGYTFAMVLSFMSIVTGFLFVRQEKRHPNPILSVRIMKQRQIMFGAGSAIMAYMGLYAMIFLLPFYFQDLKGLSETRTGIFLVVIPLALSIMGPPAGFLAEKFNAKYLATLGALLQTISTLVLGIVFVLFNKDIANWLILLLVGLSAAFLSLFTNPNGTSVMNASEKADLSIISGVLNLARNIGFTLGTTFATVIFAFFRNQFGSEEFAIKYTNALGYTYIIFSIFTLIGVILSFNRGKEIINRY